MVQVLDPSAAQQTVDHFVANWTPSETSGYDPQATGDLTAYLPIATTLDNVGEVYPSVVVTPSNEPAPSPTGYEFQTPNGPGSNPLGQVVVTVRAEERESDSYRGTDAESIASDIAHYIEAHIGETAHAPSGTDFTFWSGFQANPPNDDRSEGDTTYIEQVTVNYSYTKTPI
jgi:hypothetical protein